MSDREAFLKKIIDYPDDDTPRLVFADWLDENGEPDQAEFIRVQCELAGTNWDTDGLAWSDALSVEGKAKLLREREKELFKANRWKFLRWLTTEFPGVCEDSKFHRGFIDSITCSWANWLAHHEQILTQTPLKNVELTTRPPYQWVGNVADLGSPPESGLKHIWPRLKFTLPPIQWPVELPRGNLITLPPGWVVRGSTGIQPSEVYEGFRRGDAMYLASGISPTPSAEAAPPAPPNDPSSDDGNI